MEANLPLLLEALNTQWGQTTFPKEWKTAKVVLLEKPRKEHDTVTTYRPICLLSELAKVYERILKGRCDIVKNKDKLECFIARADSSSAILNRK